MIGREDDLARLAMSVQPGALTTLIGPAGVGKTSLAVELGRVVEGAYPSGVVFVDLTPLREPAAVTHAVARLLNVRESGSAPLLELVANAVRARETLLILDNCEHLVSACRAFLAALFAEPGSSAVLATSRVALGVGGERLFPLNPLSAGAAEALFRLRARSRSDGEAREIAAICRRLDCLPLAIELAAARTNILSTVQIAERLDRRFEMLPPLDAAIAWSSDLLSPEEGALFRKLGVFAGPFDLAAVEAVAGERDVIDLLDRLTMQSMVVVEHASAPEAPRFRLLDSLGAYARRWLAQTGEAEAARRRHADHFAGVAIESARALNGADQVSALATFARARENLTAALAWLIGAGDAETAVALAAAMGRFWRRRAFFVEGAEWLDRALAMPGAEETSGYVTALNEFGLLHAAAGRLDDAERALTSALRHARRLGDRAGEGHAYDNLGLVHRGRSDLPRAAEAHQTAFGIFTALDDRRAAGSARLNLALIANLSGDSAAGKQGCHEAWALLRGRGDLLQHRRDHWAARAHRRSARLLRPRAGALPASRRSRSPGRRRGQ